MEGAVEVVPGRTMGLLAAQQAFVEADERFVAFIGGVGSGKTVAGAIKALRYVMEYPGAVGVVGAPNKTVLRDVTERTLRTLLPKEFGIKERKSDGVIEFPNGSEIWFRSMDDFEHRRGLYFF
ncbi:MAG: hypothetical protein H0X24_17130 [Ktedonobacterales bacterium]|nr:hypothetical protein [Ktedonobacterales bacterium]